jgi:mono/diheme cytochrome c family protein
MPLPAALRSGIVRAVRSLPLLIAVVGCTSSPAPSTQTYPEVPADPQRPGDAAKGYDYLVNGGYITCGLPRSVWNRFAGPASPADTIPGRTGDAYGLPYSFSPATSTEGVKVVSANCLTCHAGRINGKLVIGLGAADADFTSGQSAMIDAAAALITDPTEKAEYARFSDRIHTIEPYTQPATIGVNPADNLTAVLMSHRDPATLAWSDTAMIELPPATVAPVDVPPWWRMAKKNAMFYSTAGRGDHARIMMAASLLCTDNVAEATAIDAAFVDVRAWIEQLAPPAWPFAIDRGLASKGEAVYERTCARCHGIGENYPNSLVPLDVIGTDPVLARGTAQFAPPYVAWFQSSFWGQMSRLVPQNGYIAPPLDGIWATAPYFHNGSVPTLEGVLDSHARPKYWVRPSYDSTDFDQTKVGWNYTAITHGQADEPTKLARVKIYDTTLPGYANSGHTFGDGLSSADRTAVIEYLKTL